jgi:hypothetical protein
MQSHPQGTDMNTGIGGIGGLVDLQTTIAGFEVTLETLVEISNLLKRLDERLAQLSPDLPQINQVANGGQSLSGSFAAMLTAYQEAFAAMATAARSAALLGLGGDKPVALNVQTNDQATAQATIPKAPEPVLQPEAATSPAEASAPEPVATQVSQPEPAIAAAPPQEVPAAAPAAPVAAQVMAPQAEGESLMATSDWKPLTSDASRRNFAVAPAGKQLKNAVEIIKPLKPIEMPAVDHPVGPMIANQLAATYAHGPEVRKFWPGQRDAKSTLDAPIPNDAWRLLKFEESLFCIAADKVFVLGAAELNKQGNFPGVFVGQVHTASSWAGLELNDGALSIVFRGKTGKDPSEAMPLGAPGDAQVYMAASGEAVYIAFSTGELFRAESSSAVALPRADKNGTIIGIAVDSRGLIVTSTSAQGVILSVLDQNGKSVKDSAVVAGKVTFAPAMLETQMFLVDDSKSEVVTVSLDTLQVVSRKPVEGILAVGKLIALQEDKGATLAILARDNDGRPSDVFLHAIESGETTKVCHISATKGDMAYTDGHLIVTSTSSLQNMIQIFGIYGPAIAAKAA